MQWIVPVSFVLGGYVSGRIFERLILSWIRRLTQISVSKGDDVFVNSLGNTTTLWFSLPGFYLQQYNEGLRLHRWPARHSSIRRVIEAIVRPAEIPETRRLARSPDCPPNGLDCPDAIRLFGKRDTYPIGRE